MTAEASDNTRAIPDLLDRTALITPRELLAYLNDGDEDEGAFTLETLNQWASRGGGPKFIRVGRHRRYHPADVRDWLLGRRFSVTGEAA